MFYLTVPFISLVFISYLFLSEIVSSYEADFGGYFFTSEIKLQFQL